MRKARTKHNRKALSFRADELRKTKTLTVRLSVRPGSEETNPHHVDTLWKLVRAAPLTPPRAPESLIGGEESWIDEEVSYVNNKEDWIDEAEYVADEDEACYTENDSRLTMEFHPGTTAFDATVLAPRGIAIHPFGAFTTPFHHFQTSPPPSSKPPAAHYQRIPALRHTPASFWLDPANAQAISNAYNLLHRDAFPAAEYKAEALSSLFRAATPHTATPAKPTDDLPFQLPYRLLGESFLPAWDTPTTWTSPPVLAPPSSTSGNATASTTAAAGPLLAEALAPAVSYLLCTAGLGAADATKLEDVVHVRYRHMCCPYLAVEVSGDGSDAARLRARQVVAAAAAVGLWNRVRLAELGGRRAVGEGGYGVVVVGVSFEVWVLRARMGAEGAWEGCEMVQVAGGQADDGGMVGELMAWVNEIQRWGNTVYAQGCAEDVRVVMAKGRGEAE